MVLETKEKIPMTSKYAIQLENPKKIPITAHTSSPVEEKVLISHSKFKALVNFIKPKLQQSPNTTELNKR